MRIRVNVWRMSLTTVWLASLALALAGCSTNARNGVSKALSGNTGPGATTQPATPGSAIGITESIQSGASTAAGIPGPWAPYAAIVSALAGVALVGERAWLKWVAGGSLGNGESGSGSNSTSPPRRPLAPSHRRSILRPRS